MNKYLEEGLIKSEDIFYKWIFNRWSVGFTKPMIDFEILADSQHLFTITDVRTKKNWGRRNALEGKAEKLFGGRGGDLKLFYSSSASNEYIQYMCCQENINNFG